MGRAILAAIVLIVCAGLAQAGTRADLSGDAVVDFVTTMDMPFMTVGNPGNAGDTEVMWQDGTSGYGGVGYTYNIGKFEVTAGQYTEFLNAVAATDTYGLYNPDMRDDPQGMGCNIQRSGSAGSYSYSVAADWADRPVNFVGWGDAARFANWLTNGMPSGAQDLTTTEDGSYYLNGATSRAELLAVSVPDAAQRAAWSQGPKRYYLLPSEDEWYKAAYHKNDGVTGHYFDFPTNSDFFSSNALIDPDPGSNANIRLAGFTINMPYYRTEVGEFENSESPYGTFDQGGNVWEWNEAVIGSFRGLRGQSFYDFGYGLMRSSYRRGGDPLGEFFPIGFRIAEVPEPATMSLLGLGGLTLLRRRKGK